MKVKTKRYESARMNMRMPRQMKELLFALGCYLDKNMTDITLQALDEYFRQHGIVWQEWNGDISQFRQ